MKDEEVGLLARTIGGKILQMASDGSSFELKIEVPNPNPRYYNEPFILIRFTDFGWEIMKSEK